MADARAAAFFDLDRTLIGGTSTYDFAVAAWRSGMLDLRDLVGDALGAWAFKLFGATDERSESTRDRILQAVEGQSQADLIALNEEIVPRLLERVRPESRSLVDMHHEAGRDCWIASASPVEMVEPMASALGMEGAVGTVPEVLDGRYTGRLDGPFVYGEGKAEAIEKLAAQRGYDLRLCYAYSDSSSDLPMMEAVGHPVAVNPDRALETVARQRGWPMVEFSHRTKQVVRTTTALTSGAALAGATYVLGRRHGRLAASLSRSWLPWR